MNTIAAIILIVAVITFFIGLILWIDDKEKPAKILITIALCLGVISFGVDMILNPGIKMPDNGVEMIDEYEGHHIDEDY